MIYETEVILRVSALGPGMMSYQWIKDGRVITKSNLPSITGEDSATLYINKFSHAHDGEYHCIVSNESCMLVTECAIIQGMYYNYNIPIICYDIYSLYTS